MCFTEAAAEYTYLCYLCTDQDCICSLHSGLITLCLGYNGNQSGLGPALTPDDTVVVHKSYGAAGNMVLSVEPTANIKFNILPASF